MEKSRGTTGKFSHHQFIMSFSAAPRMSTSSKVAEVGAAAVIMSSLLLNRQVFLGAIDISLPEWLPFASPGVSRAQSQTEGAQLCCFGGLLLYIQTIARCTTANEMPGICNWCWGFLERSKLPSTQLEPRANLGYLSCSRQDKRIPQFLNHFTSQPHS